MQNLMQLHTKFQPIPVITAGCSKKHFNLYDVQILPVFMRNYLGSATVDEVEKIFVYFRENMYIFMELPILEVCSMIINHFGILSRAIPEMLDFIMVSLMGYQKLTMLMYVIDGFFFKLMFTGAGDWKTRNVDIRIEYISPMDQQPIDAETTLNIGKKLGSGTFSDVFFATFQKYGESHPSRYAIKLYTDPETAKDDFYYETEILSVLRGTGGVINVEFYLEISVLGQTFFAYGMPYFENGTLHDYAKNLSECDILNMLKDLAEMTRVCHEKGVFHADIKPENILVNSSGEPVLADFGIGKHTDSKHWIMNADGVRYSQPWRDPWNFLQEKNSCLGFKVSILSEIWALLLSILDCLSRGEYHTHPMFAVFQNGTYSYPISQKLVNDAIDCLFDSDCLKSKFFKKWLDIETFMTLTSTISETNLTFMADRYREFFHDLGIVIASMNEEENVKPSKTESSDSDSD